MSLFAANLPIQLAHNARSSASADFADRQHRVLDPTQCSDARREIRTWPGFAETPLLHLTGLAKAVGLAQIWYKDEAGRFGLGSFKALGGAYAVSRILIEHIAARTGKRATTADLLSGRHRGICGDVTVTCATDGNHGRSVAWGAHQFGCGCVIYIHETVSEGRRHAIERFGAQVIRTAGNYDDSVRQASEDAARFDRVVVSDTSYPGYMEIPQYVMQGYTELAEECIVQLRPQRLPTHIFLQGGVGGFAAAVIATFRDRFGIDCPRIVVVEPDRAACIYASIEAGRPVALAGDLDTVMAGLACGEVSLLAWEILEQGVDDVLTIADEAAVECMRILASGFDGDKPVVAGESAVAGLAGALMARERDQLGEALDLDAGSRVLVVGTEGTTDPDVYRELVGRSAEEVSAA